MYRPEKELMKKMGRGSKITLITIIREKIGYFFSNWFAWLISYVMRNESLKQRDGCGASKEVIHSWRSKL